MCPGGEVADVLTRWEGKNGRSLYAKSDPVACCDLNFAGPINEFAKRERRLAKMAATVGHACPIIIR